MTTTTATLADFLLARIADDEAEANATMRQYREGGDTSSRRWRRALADCAAHRRIVHLHPPKWMEVELPRKLGSLEIQDERVAGPIYDEELFALASVYSDHPDFRDEWRA